MTSPLNVYLELEKQYRNAAELVCLANDYLQQHWDMKSFPLYKIAEFAEQYLEALEAEEKGGV